MKKHTVVIAGGGPTGLMLAGELALAGIDVAIVEKRASQALEGSRGGGLHPRTIEVFDQRGIADRFLAEGQKGQSIHFAAPLSISDLPTRHNYVLGLWQNHIERIMAGWVSELPVTFYREREVTGFSQDDSGVDVHLSDGEPLRAEYLVGCDGGRSVIRKTAGIAFPGWDATTSWMIAEAEMVDPQLGPRSDAAGTYGIGRVNYEIRDGQIIFSDHGPVRVVLTERRIVDGEPALSDLKDALIDRYGTDFGVHNVTWLSRFTDMTRQASAYRDRRVLLAGDAAHVHPPLGGQGLNIGVQDAMNLGWKLAQVVKQISPDSLLDTYHAERHPIAARVLKHTMAQVALGRQDDRTKALAAIVAELAVKDAARKHLAADLSGLGIRYDLGEGHPLLGRRMPDLELQGSGIGDQGSGIGDQGSGRLYSFLHSAHAVLLNLGEAGSIDITGWADRVRLIEATYEGAWELPALGTVTAPAAALIRPDGYVAWVGDSTQKGLADALIAWCGAGQAPHFPNDQEKA